MARRPGLPTGRAVSRVLVGCCCCPEEARQLAGTRHDGHVVCLAAAPHTVIDPVQPVLGAVSDLQNMIGLALLAVAERYPDPWVSPVVPGCLDEQPASEARARLRDRSLVG
jgi:hypothetical protein